MTDREKVIKGLEICSKHGAWHGLDCEINEAYKDCPYRGCKTGCIVTIAKDALALLKEQEPARHGQWEPSPIPCEKYVCSCCGGACWYYDYEGDVAKSNYCPNCGAKMDRRTEDGFQVDTKTTMS